MYRRRFSRFPRRKIIRRRRGLGKKRVSKSIKKYVKATIHKQIENKEHIAYAANQTIMSAGTVNDPYSFPLLPSLSQGTNDSERIGNQVKIVKGQLRATVNLKPYNSTTNNNSLPVWVKIWVVRSLRSTEQEFTMPDYDRFFKGNGAVLNWQGNCLDLDLPVNNDEFRILKTMTFKIGQTNYNSNSLNGGGWNDNSPFSKRVTINWAKYVRKQLKYTTDINNCMNANLYFLCQAVSADGTSSDGKEMIEIHYVNTTRYEDA